MDADAEQLLGAEGLGPAQLLPQVLALLLHLLDLSSQVLLAPPLPQLLL